jgi:rare lipoprotein A
MRHLMTAAVLSLLIGAAAALPAAADNGERSARERSVAWHSYGGGRAEHRHRQHFAYAALHQGYDHEAWPRRPRRVHGAMHPMRKARSARHSHARFARFTRHRHRLAHHARAGRRTAALHAPHRVAPGLSRHLGTIEPRGSGQQGMASFYSEPQRLATGGWFNPNALTAAHRSLPFGTRVRVTHKGSGRSVDVTINDRGPYVAGRIIDLSRAAAGVIGMTAQGVARVTVQVLGR